MTPPPSSTEAPAASPRGGSKRNSSSSSSAASAKRNSNHQEDKSNDIMHHQVEIMIPGPFVVLHGSAGDGMRNSIHSCPDPRGVFDDDMILQSNATDESFEHVQDVTMQEASVAASPPRNNNHLPLGVVTSSASSSAAGRRMGVSNYPVIGSHPVQHRNSNQNRSGGGGDDDDDPYIVVTDDAGGEGGGSSSSASSSPAPQQQRFSSSSHAVSTTPRRQSSSRNNQHHHHNNPRYQEAIAEWTANGRAREIRQRHEWLQQAQNGSISDNQWWQIPQTGHLAVFRELPTMLAGSHKVMTKVMGSVPPGATILGHALHTLDSATFQRVNEEEVATTLTAASESNDNEDGQQQMIYPQGKQGWIQFLQVEHVGRTGYVVLSLDGYPLLLPGLPSLYVDPRVWLWRVTCPVGAVVREGLDLTTRHLDTLPYGSVVRVTRKTINGMGLSRLRISSIAESTSTTSNSTSTTSLPLPRVVDGWCSEFLNPLSGQRGMVAQPISFPVPALYRVTLPVGAVVRQDVELSSRQLGTIPCNSIIVIVARAFSEHPMDKCLERLELAGNGGWISVRLNRPPPEDDLVVEFVGTDGTFEPETPGQWHLDATQKVQASEFLPPPQDHNPMLGRHAHGNNNDNDADISSIDEEEDEEEGYSKMMQTTTTAQQQLHGPKDRLLQDKCLICLSESRNATLVHGETGHIACCLVCARILKARGDSCPVCRLRIDSVIQHFWA